MRRLLTRAALLAAPFLLVAAFVFAVDPYDYFGRSHWVSDAVKESTAGELHYALWKVQKFRRAPAHRILLGDSRMADLSTATIRSLTGEEYFNFAYGGGTIEESIDTYWLASSITRLDAVYIDMGLVNFNEYQTLNRVAEIRSIEANPLIYLSNRLVMRAAFLAAYVAATGRQVNVEASTRTPEEFWKYQVEESMPQLLHRYAYPVDIAKRLQAVAADCKLRGTRFVIIIPPEHVDLLAQIHALGRDEDQERFKKFAATLGTVFDFDYPNDLTRSRAAFGDPFHFRDNNELIEEVWGGRIRYARRSP
jgi:hypothetical protein